LDGGVHPPAPSCNPPLEWIMKEKENDTDRVVTDKDKDMVNL